jgi:hypothetical protein
MKTVWAWDFSNKWTSAMCHYLVLASRTCSLESEHDPTTTMTVHIHHVYGTLVTSSRHVQRQRMMKAMIIVNNNSHNNQQLCQ